MLLFLQEKVIKDVFKAKYTKHTLFNRESLCFWTVGFLICTYLVDICSVTIFIPI
jgi:hypothetical protein